MSFRKVLWGLILFGLIFLPCNFAFAGNIESEIAELKQRIGVLEERITEQEWEFGEQTEIAESLEQIKEVFEGLTIGASATFVMQGTNNANGDNLTKNEENATDVSYSIDLEFEKEFDDYGKAFIHLEAGKGEGVEDELKVFSSVNRDADNDENVRLTEVWYEHYFESLPLTVTFGKIGADGFIDANEYANDEAAQFLGRIFRNSPALEFPDDNNAGVRFGLEPVDYLDIELVAMDANDGWEDIFDNIFLSGQLNFKPNFFQRPGNYRVYGWLNDKDHIKWDDVAKVKKTSYGFGLSFDQELTDVVGVFARYGWQDPEVYASGSSFSLEQSWSAGIQLAGGLWGRDDDVFAIAFGQVMPSDDYKKAGSNLNAKDESHLEAYYSFKINDHLTVSPDIQVIWDPYGGDATNGDKTIFVGGVRTQIDF